MIPMNCRSELTHRDPELVASQKCGRSNLIGQQPSDELIRAKNAVTEAWIHCDKVTDAWLNLAPEIRPDRRDEVDAAIISIENAERNLIAAVAKWNKERAAALAQARAAIRRGDS